ACIAPQIVTHPAWQPVKVGQAATFSVNVSGTSPFTYQWFRAGQQIPGATSPTFTINNVQEAHFGPYYVIVSNACGSVTSHSANLTVYLEANPPIADPGNCYVPNVWKL